MAARRWAALIKALHELKGGTSAGYRVSARLLDAAGAAVLEGEIGESISLDAGAEETLAASFPVKAPAKWSAEEPNLYTLLLTLTDPAGSVQEVERVNVGFRKVEIKQGVFYFNGVRDQAAGRQPPRHAPRSGPRRLPGIDGPGRRD